MLGATIITMLIASGALLAVLVIADRRKQSPVALLSDAFGVGVALWGERIQAHPRRGWAIVESGLWLAMLIPLLEHLARPEGGWMAYWIWALTIIPHEGGHLICSPFGWFLMVAGGSIWQILFWVLAGFYPLLVRRQIAGAFFAWMIVGHSFINLSVYIRDAQERQLDLLFGMDEDAHDWWNLLRVTDLLPYDDLIADMSLALGGWLALAMIGLGLFSVWFLPNWNRGKRRRVAPR